MTGLPGSGAPVVRGLQALATLLLVCVQVAAVGSQDDRRRQGRIDEELRREANALVRIADAVAVGQPVSSDFSLSWHNDFFKAQPGTFVPFTLTFRVPESTPHAALMYVRVQEISPRAPARPPAKASREYAYETIFPVRVESAAGEPVTVRRGFAVAPGRYRVMVILRQWAEDAARQATGRRLTAVAIQDLEVPDFWINELTTSSVILAERLEPVREPVPAAELDEDPYVVGSTRIHPAGGRSFARKQELIVVFLVYNPSVGSDKQFDVQVDYHLYRQNPPDPAGGGGRSTERPGERYITRTNPQRFNPSLMGPGFDPAAGAPILAGQGILLADFEPGEYRLGITVTDLLSRRAISRDVTFRVVGS